MPSSCRSTADRRWRARNGSTRVAEADRPGPARRATTSSSWSRPWADTTDELDLAEQVFPRRRRARWSCHRGWSGFPTRWSQWPSQAWARRPARPPARRSGTISTSKHGDARIVQVTRKRLRSPWTRGRSCWSRASRGPARTRRTSRRSAAWLGHHRGQLAATEGVSTSSTSTASIPADPRIGLADGSGPCRSLGSRGRR